MVPVPEQDRCGGRMAVRGGLCLLKIYARRLNFALCLLHSQWFFRRFCFSTGCCVRRDRHLRRCVLLALCSYLSLSSATATSSVTMVCSVCTVEADHGLLLVWGISDG
jgi:hypothetical protein